MSRDMRWGLAGLAVVLIAAGAVLIWQGSEHRHAEVIPWGLLVPGYVFFALMATGSSIVNSIYTVFGYKGPNGEYEKIIKLGVFFSLVTIIPAWIMILMDLSKGPLAAMNMFIHTKEGFSLFFQPRSAIAWMALLYMIFALTLLIELIYFIRSEVSEKLRKVKSLELAIALAVLTATVLVHSNLGQVFGNVMAIPAWYGPHMAVYFIISAIIIGAAGQALFLLPFTQSLGVREFTTWYYSRILMISLPILAFIKGWMVINSYYSPASWEAYREVVSTPNFYVFEVILLLVLPFIAATVAYYRKNTALLILAALSLVVAGFVDKYDLIIHPQIAFIHSYLGKVGHVHYAPAEFEIMISTGAVLVYIALLILGVLLLPLKPGEKPKTLYIFK
ncbi:NrfD/PsrC family molybdoenzyme membrane anchor subunit [Pyrobaculum ferrireducens]|nr:NrfD/PsrC family molybdoenzyme membrane anchor subunit [Pyrobaculum ferrireducens]